MENCCGADPCFRFFEAPVDTEKVPGFLPNPFTDEVDAVAVSAAQVFLDWAQAQFWYPDLMTVGKGKMFGVLVVEFEEVVGYLAAFSGMLGGSWQQPGFVDPIFDVTSYESLVKDGAQKITRLSAEIATIENSDTAANLFSSRNRLKSERDLDLSLHKNYFLTRKQTRKLLRVSNKLTANSAKSHNFSEYSELDLQSQLDNRAWRDVKQHWKVKLETAEMHIANLEKRLARLKRRRSKFSNNLQHDLFNHYQLTDRDGNKCSMSRFFKKKMPPGGAGDCAAPKLLQHAHRFGYKPLALAEFWLGGSQRSGVREHARFYPPCRSKCAPILPWMMHGWHQSRTQTLPTIPPVNSAELVIHIVFEDEHIAVIEKPVGLLSVPGKVQTDSVQNRLGDYFPASPEARLVHRLDFDTSGLLLVAKNIEIYRLLQRQFLDRIIKKEYVAILEGFVASDRGSISLPLRVDLEDRPRQLVCVEYGKPAYTSYQVLERRDHKAGVRTRVKFMPVTGRTHQLRIHSAHALGLNAPIVGDPLYGIGQGIGNTKWRCDRMFLHAAGLSFIHPITKLRIEHSSKVPF